METLGLSPVPLPLAANLPPAPAFSGSRVLITGASGMVGSWLTKDLLARGAEVIALIQDMDPQSELFRSGDSTRITVVNGRLEDYWTLERAINVHEVNTVFHLGAQTQVRAAHRSPLPTFEANIRGTYNILEACRNHETLVKRVVIASSDKAYGDQPELPYTEEMPLDGRHPYEVSKSCAELISRTYHHTYGMPLAIARCGNIYGGGDLNWERIVPGTIRSFTRKEAPLIRSDGTFVRDYLYVKDAVSAYLRLAEQLDGGGIEGQSFNFAAATPLTVLDIVEAIRLAMGCDEIRPIICDEARGEIKNQYVSAAKAQSVLGWTAQYGLDEGLSETIGWYREFFR